MYCPLLQLGQSGPDFTFPSFCKEAAKNISIAIPNKIIKKIRVRKKHSIKIHPRFRLVEYNQEFAAELSKFKITLTNSVYNYIY